MARATNNNLTNKPCKFNRKTGCNSQNEIIGRNGGKTCKKNGNTYRNHTSGPVSVSENASRYVAQNIEENELDCYMVDGHIIDTNEENKCDYLLYNYTKGSAYLIELKGSCKGDHGTDPKTSQYSKAISQINNTVILLTEELKDFKVHARIVAKTSVPRTMQNEVNKKIYVPMDAFNIRYGHGSTPMNELIKTSSVVLIERTF